MDLEHISELISSGRNQNYSSTRTVQHLGSVKEHGPVLGVNLSRQLLFDPLGEEICYCLAFFASNLISKGRSSIAHLATRPVASLLFRISDNGASLTTIME